MGLKMEAQPFQRCVRKIVESHKSGYAELTGDYARVGHGGVEIYKYNESTSTTLYIPARKNVDRRIFVGPRSMSGLS